MYATRTEVLVAPGKSLAWETFWTRVAEPGKAQPGFQVFIEAHPNSKYASTPVSGDSYEVVRQV